MSENKKKFLLLTLEFPPQVGGVARYYEKIAKLLDGEVEVLLVHLNKRIWPRWILVFKNTWQLFKQNQFQFILVGQVLHLGYVALMFKIFFGVKYIVFVHGMDVLMPQKNWWKKMWLKKVLSESQAIVANSKFTKNETNKIIDGVDKIKIIYPCVEEVGHSEIEDKKEKIILSVGRLVERKGFDYAIKALPQVLQNVPSAKYVIIGSGGYKKKLSLLVSELNLQEKVIFLEGIGDEELKHWYKKSTVFVLPCRQVGGDVEGLGTVLLEAASFQLPVIVGNSGGAPEALVDKKTGLLVDPRSTEEIAAAIVEILSNSEKAKKMGEAGRNLVEEKFLCHQQLPEFLKIVK